VPKLGSVPFTEIVIFVEDAKLHGALGTALMLKGTLASINFVGTK
jgi:hypothetical protein